jgi:hypothetical protein
LGDQVKRDHRKRAHRCSDSDRRLAEAERDDVCEGVLAEIPQWFRNEKHHYWPSDQKSDRVDQSVEP